MLRWSYSEEMVRKHIKSPYELSIKIIISSNSDSIRGYDRTGKEMFWIVTNGHVKSMALIDINKDGRNEVSAIRTIYL